MASGEQGRGALELISRLPLVPEPIRNIAPEADSPTFFLPGVTDTDVLASLVPALVALGSDDVRVGRPAERLEKGGWIVRLCWELRNKPAVVAIWQDVRVSNEMGGIGIAVKSKVFSDLKRATFIIPGLAVAAAASAGTFALEMGIAPFTQVIPWFWHYVGAAAFGAYLAWRVPTIKKQCRLEEIPQKAAIMRDSVVACIEQVFRELRIPEGMIKRSGKTG
jgi:hypothetical protein